MGCRQKQSAPENSPAADPGISVDSLLARQFSVTAFRKLQGHFISTDKDEYAVLFESKLGHDIGVAVSVCTISQNAVAVEYSSPVVDGALKQATFQQVVLPGVSDTALYYDSGDFFMGSGSGEVYVYVIFPKTNTIVKGHLFLTGEAPPRLFVPESTTATAVRTYIFNKFKDQYPGLKFAQKDITID
jgi:hypothetical protein